MKKKYIAWIFGVCAVLVASIGGTAASRYSKSQTSLKENISEKDLGIVACNDIQDQQVQEAVLPGAQSHLGYYVKNNGGSAAEADESYNIYAKIEVFYSFSKDKQEIISDSDKPVVSFIINDGNNEYRLDDYISSYEEGKKLGDWIIAYFDEQQIVMYYTKPIGFEENSSEFLSGVEFSEDMGNEYANSHFAMETEVTAVQTDSGRAAIAAEWGVYPEINSDGIITSISESK